MSIQSQKSPYNHLDVMGTHPMTLCADGGIMSDYIKQYKKDKDILEDILAYFNDGVSEDDSQSELSGFNNALLGLLIPEAPPAVDASVVYDRVNSVATFNSLLRILKDYPYVTDTSNEDLYVRTFDLGQGVTQVMTIDMTNPNLIISAIHERSDSLFSKKIYKKTQYDGGVIIRTTYGVG